MRQFTDIKNRRKIWEALSNLFLDTDVSLLYDSTALQLSKTTYSLIEIEQIFIEDVYPICKWNLYSVAGEWTGFDLDWLENKIVNSRKPMPWGWNRFFALRSLKMSLDSQVIKQRISKLRESK